MKQKKPEADIYRKSGTWKEFRAGSGAIMLEDNEYIIVALVEHPKGGDGLVELIVFVDEFMDSMKQ